MVVRRDDGAGEGLVWRSDEPTLLGWFRRAGRDDAGMREILLDDRGPERGGPKSAAAVTMRPKKRGRVSS